MRLGSGDWHERLLQKLMSHWDGMKPMPLMLPDLSYITDYLEADALQLEEAIVRFYTDFFFCFLVVLLLPAYLP